MTDTLVGGRVVMKAWRTELHGMPGIVFAETRARARRTTQLSALDAGYAAPWVGIRAVRAKDLDGYDLGLQILRPGICYSEEHVRRIYDDR